MVASALSAAGIVVGALVGARIAPHLLPGGDDSAYTPLVGLAGAAVGAVALEAVEVVGSVIRRAMRVLSLRLIDSFGGLVIGAATGLVLVWVLGAAALHVPGQTDLRRTAQRSAVLQTLNDVVPPSRLMDAIERVDPFPMLAGPLAPVDLPDRAVLDRPGVSRAGGASSGCSAPRAALPLRARAGSRSRDSSSPPPTSSPGKATRSSRRAAARPSTRPRSHSIRGTTSPCSARRDSPFAALLSTHRRAGRRRHPRLPRRRRLHRRGRADWPTSRVLSERLRRRPGAADDHVPRRVRRGNSGGPEENAAGRVEAMIFAARVGSEGGYGVPTSIVRDVSADARRRSRPATARPKRDWRNVVCCRGVLDPPDAASSVGPICPHIEALCVLASKRPAHPGRRATFRQSLQDFVTHGDERARAGRGRLVACRCGSGRHRRMGTAGAAPPAAVSCLPRAFGSSRSRVRRRARR